MRSSPEDSAEENDDNDDDDDDDASEVEDYDILPTCVVIAQSNSKKLGEMFRKLGCKHVIVFEEVSKSDGLGLAESNHSLKPWRTTSGQTVQNSC